jgi:glyoxylase-like metal-dependent hydrolase (beta-lactamase superfamily II)
MDIIKIPSWDTCPFDRAKLETYTRISHSIFPPTCAYIIASSRKNAALVNAPGNIDVIMRILENFELKLKFILLTNGHVEHIYGLSEITKKTGAIAYLHEKDQAGLNNYANDSKELLGITEPEPYGGIFTNASEKEVIQLDEIIITILHTPGVTDGSVTYLAERALFTGDLIARQAVGHVSFPGSSSKKLLGSLMRLHNLDGDYNIYPSHWGETTLDRERKTNLALLPSVRMAWTVTLIE